MKVRLRFFASVCVFGAAASLWLASPSAQRAPVVLSAELPGLAGATGDGVLAQRDAVLEKFRSRIAGEGNLPVIVGLRMPAFDPTAQLDPNQAFARQLDLSRVQQRVVSRLPMPATGIHEFQFIPYLAMRVDQVALDALLADPEVAWIQEDALESPTLAQSVPLIQGDLAHTAGYTGAGQAVAILDTGVEKTHSAFGGRVVSEACYSGAGSVATDTICPGGGFESTAVGSGVNCSVATDGDACEHGTHVAGIAAGSSGVAPGANIIAVQVFSRINGTVGDIRSYVSDQIKGLERVYALRNTYAIASANMSLGGGRNFSTCDGAQAGRKAIIDLLRTAGIATVIASGNDGYIDSMGAPGCISTAISVGSTTKADVVSSFSNSVSFLSLLAPGSSITSAIPGNSTASFNGTSMATPHVAGAWALLKDKDSTLSVAAGLSALQTTGLAVLDSRNGLTHRRILVNDALNTLAGSEVKAAVTSPTPGTTLDGTSATFEWSAGTGALEYWISVGTGGAGTSNIVTASTGLTQSRAVTGLPTTGGTVYVRLFTRFASGWQHTDYTYTATSAVKGAITSPSNGATLSGGSQTFTWSAGSGALEYWISVGTGGAGTSNILTTSTALATSRAVTGLPTTGGTVYVRLFTRFASGWQHNDYTYTAASQLKAAITSPSNGATLAGTSTTFTWSAGSGALEYWISVGTGGAGTSNILATSTALATSRAVTGLPTTGGTVNVRLFTRFASGWQHNDYTFTAASLVKAAMTSPTQGATLAGGTTTFNWSSGSGALEYWITVGTGGAGTSNILSASTALVTSRMVSGLPTTGGTVNVRLWTRFTSGWQFTDYTYTAASLTPAVPTSLSVVGTTTSTRSFRWQASAGATWYRVWVNDAGGKRVDQWVSAADAGCGAGSGTCAFIPNVSLDGAQGQFWVLSWTMAGGSSAWSSGFMFSLP